MKAGFAGYNFPSTIIPSIVGQDGTKYYIGEKAKNKQNIHINHPIKHGIVKGDALTYAAIPTTMFEVTDDHLSKYFMNFLTNSSFSSKEKRKIIGDMKEKLYYVTLDYQKKQTDSSFKLPDGQIIKIGKERFLTPEALFQPSFFKMEACGIHTAIYNSIKKCHFNIHKDLYANTVLTGDGMYPGEINIFLYSILFFIIFIIGIVDCLKTEITALAPLSARINVTFHPGSNSVWNGGSILASLPIFQQMLVHKEDWTERGREIIHRYQ